MTTVETHIGKLEAQLSHWGAKLDELVTKAEQGGAEAKHDTRRRIDELKAKHRAAQAKLEEFKAAGSVRWDQFKTGVESACSELENAFKALKH